MKRTFFLGGVSSRRSCKVFIEPFNFSFFSITGQGIDLDYRDIQWFALEMNRDYGRTDAEAPILWPSNVKRQLIGKDPDLGKVRKAGGEGGDRG